jgi:mersacidin/lichenicidin family type 2 lantibiotic
MSKKLDFIRAWKDEEYRLTLSADEVARLPENPAGVMNLSDSELGLIAGADDLYKTEQVASLGCCPGITRDDWWCTSICPTWGPCTPITTTM